MGNPAIIAYFLTALVNEIMYELLTHPVAGIQCNFSALCNGIKFRYLTSSPLIIWCQFGGGAFLGNHGYFHGSFIRRLNILRCTYRSIKTGKNICTVHTGPDKKQMASFTSIALTTFSN